MPKSTKAFHAQTPDDVLEAMEVTPRKGLSRDQIADRREQFGDNQIRQSGRRSVLRIWIAQFRSVVVATGMKTELGHIAEMAEEADSEETTPLEHRLNRLGRRLAWVALGAAAVVGAAGLLAGRPTLLMIETAIALGVAAIPEGLPFVATIALARGMWLMARKQALINRLPAVETLGATNIILSDKTGTLTENRMVAAVLVTPSGEYDLQQDNPSDQSADDGRPERDDLFTRALEIGVLCNNASARDKDGDGKIDETQGDPTEIALLTGAARWGIDRRERLDNKPEIREEAFDPEIMMMATIHKSEGKFEYAVKGAPGAVIEHCRTVAGAQQDPMNDEQPEMWKRKARELAAKGLRVLALADKKEDSSDADPYQTIRLVGLIGLLDPPRDDVRRSLEACRRAGIRVVMVTGDQPETASAIAADLVRNDITSNPWMLGAVAACTLLLVAAVYTPGLSTLLETEHPGFSGWIAILALSALPALTGQIRFAVNRRR